MGTFYKELGEKRPHGTFGPARGLLRKPWTSLYSTLPTNATDHQDISELVVDIHWSNLDLKSAHPVYDRWRRPNWRPLEKAEAMTLGHWQTVDFFNLCQNIKNTRFDGLNVISAPWKNRFGVWGNDYSLKYIVLKVGNIINEGFFLLKEKNHKFLQTFSYALDFSISPLKLITFADLNIYIC